MDSNIKGREIIKPTALQATLIKRLKQLLPNPKISLNYSSAFELYVAVVLSARNTDKKVNEVTKRLFKKYRNLSDYINANPRVFEKDIGNLGLFREKTKYILKAAKIVDKKYNGKIPDSMEEILKLPGVGRKTANVILGNLYGIVEGIAVDTHVVRLSKLFGLTKNTDPDKIEKDLMEILPQKEWFNFTYRMIEYGRAYCPARCRHKDCPLRELTVR